MQRIHTLGFLANYEVEEGTLPAAVEFDFCRPVYKDRPGGLILETTRSYAYIRVGPASGEPWVGRFEEGAEGISGTFATPSPDVLCVVAKGLGFWVPVNEPTSYTHVRSHPIKQVMRVPNRELVIFVDYTKLTAYSPNGFNWVSKDLSWDGIENVDVSNDVIRGEGWDSPAGCRRLFVVDVLTGKASGGSSPAEYASRPSSR
jgi:hypothetical protein